jgi:hypothetical protein
MSLSNGNVAQCLFTFSRIAPFVCEETHFESKVDDIIWPVALRGEYCRIAKWDY